MKQAKIIFLEDLKEAVTNKKIIFVAIIAALIIMSVYVSGFLQIAYLLFFKPSSMIPFPITITYYLLFLTVPLFALLLAHDSISLEIENSTIRGVISKISRNSFILGKFLSISAIISSLSFILLVISSAYTFIKFRELDILHPLLFLLYLVLYIAALTSVSIFFSTIFSRSSTSLFSITIFYIFLQYINIGSTGFISVFHYLNNIVSMENILQPIIVFIAYTAIFLTSSLIIFKVRDL